MKNLVTFLALFSLLAIAQLVTANDMAHYSGPTNPGWIAGGAVAANVKAIDGFKGVKAMFNKIEESCEKGVDSPGCICQIGRAYGNHSNKNEN